MFENWIVTDLIFMVLSLIFTIALFKVRKRRGIVISLIVLVLIEGYLVKCGDIFFFICGAIMGLGFLIGMIYKLNKMTKKERV